jgi:hypothetical protein
MRRTLLLTSAAVAAALAPAAAALGLMTAARDTAAAPLTVDRLERHLRVTVTDAAVASAAGGEPRALAVTLPGPVAAGATVPLGFRLTNLDPTAQTVTVGAPSAPAQVASAGFAGTLANPVSLGAGATTAQDVAIRATDVPGTATVTLRVRGAGTNTNGLGRPYAWYRDRTFALTVRPAPPTAPTAITNGSQSCGSKCVKLGWSASTSAASGGVNYVAGYRVYRRAGTEAAPADCAAPSGWTALNGGAPVAATTYSDATIPAGGTQTWTYLLCAQSTAATGGLLSAGNPVVTARQ